MSARHHRVRRVRLPRAGWMPVVVQLVLAVLLIVALFTLAGCGAPPSLDHSIEGAHQRSYADSVQEDAALATRERQADRMPGLLSSVASAPVVGWLGADSQPFEVTLRTKEQRDGHTRPFGSIARPITLRARARDLGQAPCTSCHFGRTVQMRDQRIGDAHRNIQPVHPARVGSVCSTCHAPDDVQKLALRSGERPTLDHAYRLCAQCHFAQVDSWAAGAHGKRLDGWQGQRIVMGCADCHDPHRPKTEPRTPFRAPRIERQRGDEP